MIDHDGTSLAHAAALEGEEGVAEDGRAGEEFRGVADAVGIFVRNEVDADDIVPRPRGLFGTDHGEADFRDDVAALAILRGEGHLIVARLGEGEGVWHRLGQAGGGVDFGFEGEPLVRNGAEAQVVAVGHFAVGAHHLHGGPFLFLDEYVGLDRCGVGLAIGRDGGEGEDGLVADPVDAIGLAQAEIEVRTVDDELLRGREGLLVRVGDGSGHGDAAGAGMGRLLGEGEGDGSLALRAECGSAFGAVGLLLDGAVAEIEFVKAAGAGEIVRGIDHPVQLGLGERFAHEVAGAHGEGEFRSLAVFCLGGDGHFEGVDPIIFNLEGVVGDETPVGFGLFALGCVRGCDGIEVDLDGVPAHALGGQGEGAVEAAVLAKGDFALKELAMEGVENTEAGGAFTGADEFVGIDEARDRFQFHFVAGAIDVAVGEDEGAAFAGKEVIPTLVDAEAPESDALEILVEGDDVAIFAEGGVEEETLVGAVIQIALEAGHTACVGLDLGEGRGGLVAEIQVEPGEGLARFQRKGVDGGAVFTLFPGQADVGELDERLRADGEILAGRGVAFAAEVKGAGRGSFGHVIPVERDRLGGIDFGGGVAELIVDGLAGDRFESEGLLLAPTLVFVLIIAEAEDHVIALERLHAGARPGEVAGADIELTVARGILGRGKGRVGDEPGIRHEVDFLRHDLFELGRVVGDEPVADGHFVFGAVAELAGELEAAGARFDRQTGRSGLDRDELG